MLKITPYFSQKPWAGNFISLHFKSPLDNIGEAWLLSTLPEGQSSVEAIPLSEHLAKTLPYLIKVIDAAKPLSIQVHPNDEWARLLENSKGKTECWLILNSNDDGGVYLGLKENVSILDLQKAIESNQAVDKLMNFYPVSKGDFITVPAGTIHAIGGGVTLLEVQQASGITYRLWDWGSQARELHIEKGLKVSEVKANYQIQKNIFASGNHSLLLKHPDFECWFNTHQGIGWFVDCQTLEVYQGSVPLQKPYLFVR